MILSDYLAEIGYRSTLLVSLSKVSEELKTVGSV